MIKLSFKIFILFILQLIQVTSGSLYSEVSGNETVYMHTDRTAYIAGETVFYKLYVLDAATHKRSEISRAAYIVVRSANSNPVVKIGVKVDNGLADGSFVLPDTLTSGTYQVTAFTNIMKNRGNQYFFQKEIIISNRFDKELNFKLTNPVSKDIDTTRTTETKSEITTDKPEYGLRQKVKVTLGNLYPGANLSISVFEESGLGTEDKSMVETLKTGSVLTSENSTKNTYWPEKNGKILSGRVIDEVTQKMVPSATVLLSCIDSIPNLQYAYTNSGGVFRISLTCYYSGKELFLTIHDVPQGQHWKIEIDDEFGLPDNNRKPAHFQLNDKAKEFIAKCQDIVYINKVYKQNEVITDKLIPSKKPVCPQVYHCPVKSVTPSDFVSLNDFSEIVVELFPLMKVNKNKGNYTVQVMNTSTYQYSQGPGIFLDGVFVDDVNKIMGLGSDKIKRIDVIYTERTFGDLVFPGIISVTSKSNEIAKTKPASRSLRFKNNKLQSGRSIVQFNQDSISDGSKPFFKQVLYWNPELEIKESGPATFEFYTSDNAASFIIKVEGISDDGTPVSMNKRIRVINK